MWKNIGLAAQYFFPWTDLMLTLHINSCQNTNALRFKYDSLSASSFKLLSREKKKMLMSVDQHICSRLFSRKIPVSDKSDLI